MRSKSCGRVYKVIILNPDWRFQSSHRALSSYSGGIACYTCPIIMSYSNGLKMVDSLKLNWIKYFWFLETRSKPTWLRIRLTFHSNSTQRYAYVQCKYVTFFSKHVISGFAVRRSYKSEREIRMDPSCDLRAASQRYDGGWSRAHEEKPWSMSNYTTVLYTPMRHSSLPWGLE